MILSIGTPYVRLILVQQLSGLGISQEECGGAEQYCDRLLDVGPYTIEHILTKR
jgi:hypothetical protein